MMKKNILVYCRFSLFVLAIGSCSPTTVGPHPEPKPKEEQKEKEEDTKVLFMEDFSGPIDENRWGIMKLPYSAGNKESQWYRAENLTVSGGTLKITARNETVTGSPSQAPEMSFISNDGIMRAAPQEVLPAGIRYWTSGLMNTRDAKKPTFFPLFAKFEIKAKLPHGQGLLPAFWLRRKGGASWGEIDVMEYFGNYKPGYSKFSMHFPNTIGVNATQQTTFFETPVTGTGDWHTWSVVIRPTNEHADPLQDPIAFVAYLDGEQYAYYKLTDIQAIRDLHMIDRTTGQKIDPGKPDEVWDICVNMAVGGQWVGQPDQQLGYLPIVNRCSKNQKIPTSEGCNIEGLFFAEFPATFEVDYIKVESL